MICITISQESRKLALVDLYNAAPQGDLLEVRLDRFLKAPELGDLLVHKAKPVIMTCRRTQDGGSFEGSETERLAILRQCIVGKAEYVEIELDVADQVRPFPPSKRVISYTNLEETPADLAAIYAEALTKQPDVVKLVTRARTPEEAWPLVQILAKPAVPTVVVGLGKEGLMLAVLGKKIGSPWVYAALERGMEGYPDQPTVHDLREVYHYPAIGRGTRLVGVTGFGLQEQATAAVLNAALAHLQLPSRCLPLQVGTAANFRKVIEAVHLASVVIDESNRGPLCDLAGERDSAARRAEAVDLLVREGDAWHGYNLLSRAAVGAVEQALKGKTTADKPLEGRTVMVVGTNATARAVTYGVKKRGGIPIVASPAREAARQVAQTFDCRHVQFEALYSTLHDVLVVCQEEEDPHKTGSGAGAIHGGYYKPGQTVLDLTDLPRKTQLLRDAEVRGAQALSPRAVFLDQAALQVKLLTGKEAPREVLEAALSAVLRPEE
jgi:3-dehydroquinate dehydratase/shikimate dehydrogenase